MKKSWAVFMLLVFFFAGTSAHADDDTIRLTPDAAKILRLKQDAVSVIVTNPDHASIVLDSPRLLVIMPRQPGTTSFTVLDGVGNTILEKKIIVSGIAKPQYVRIKRQCGAQDSSCVANSYSYCPDGCYEVTPVGTASPQTAPPIAAGGGGGKDNSASDEPLPPPEKVIPPTELGGGPQRVTEPIFDEASQEH